VAGARVLARRSLPLRAPRSVREHWHAACSVSRYVAAWLPFSAPSRGSANGAPAARVALPSAVRPEKLAARGTLAPCRATLAAERVERDCEAREQGRELARPVTDNGATTAVVARCNRGRVRAFTGSAAFFTRAALAA